MSGKKMKQIKTYILDRLWSKAVKVIRGGKCEYCGATSNNTQIDAHHIYGRRNYGVRFEVDNGVVLCANHHEFSTEFSAHQTPLEFTEWIKTKRSKDLIDTLKCKANKICRAFEIDRELIRDSLKEITNG